MTCDEARILIAFRRPVGGDVDPADLAGLDRHLAVCPACAAAAVRDAGFDAAVARVMPDVAVPAGLKAKLYASTGRTLSTARWRRLGRTAALAAACFAAVGLGFSIYSASRPSLDLEGLAYQNDVDGRERHAKQWLASHGLPTDLPYDFDFALCTHFGWAEVQGRTVPELLFQDPRNPAGFAKVYILTERTFNLNATPAEAGSSFVTARKIPGGPAAPGVTFLLLHTGELVRFLKAAPAVG